MRERKLITLMGTIIILGLMVVYITYSILNTSIYTENMRVETLTGTRPVFTSSGEAFVNLNINAENMSESNAGAVIDSKNMELSVALTANNISDICCDFDFTLYNNTDIQDINGLKIKIYKGSDLLQTTDVYLDPSAKTTNVFHSNICSNALTYTNYANYRINASFTNLNENQDNLYGLVDQNISIKVENVKCEVNNTASTLLLNKKQSSYAVKPGENALIDDGEKGAKYVGKNPPNYVYFNCDDYSHQSDSTCEKWRIIGIENGARYGVTDAQLIKIIRDDIIGKYPFDYTNKNNWALSQTMKALNSGYTYNGTEYTSTGIYYNRTSGTYYGTKTADFTTNGIKDSTRDMIQEVTLNLKESSLEAYGMTPIEAYDVETNSGIDYGTWTGKVVLPYIYDYMYATSGDENTNRNACLNTYFQYNSNNELVLDCFNSNWMSLSSVSYYTITGNTTSKNTWGYYILPLSSFGWGSANVNNPNMGIRPAVYLKQNVKIVSGEGTEENPYRLKLK